MRILAVSDGRRGIENQALGLAEAVARHSKLSCDVASHTLAPKGVWRNLPHSLQGPFGAVSDALLDADLLIGCGRQAIAPLIKAQRKARSNGQFLFTVYIQDPRIEPSRFDLVIAPEHDGLSGPFVETMIGSPNRVTNDRIVTETLNFAETLTTLPMPRAAFLIGGPSKRHDMDDASIQAHLDAANSLLEMNFTLLITLSRRTPEVAQAAWEVLAKAHTDRIWLHSPDCEAANPYFAFLGGADHIFITEDSTNMLTEGCATGKPVYRLPMTGQAGKFETLYAALEDRCHVKRWTGELNNASYEPLRETDRIAHIVLARMKEAERRL